VELTLRSLESHHAAERVCSFGFAQPSIRLGFVHPSDEGEVVGVAVKESGGPQTGEGSVEAGGYQSELKLSGSS
jgi:hypothetical protein